ncbi:MAG: 50S ribosomal protein L22 [Verrucomicrobia bacterium]|nr:MAG: 50S ribosomal protein L22 [Verrucomicrobiota bacterium]
MQEVQAITKYVRMSHLKLRQVAREIQGMHAMQALDLLKFIPRKSARLIHKTLTSAIANAENNHDLSSNLLTISSIVIQQGPSWKRFRPSARGMAHRYKKGTSHIHVKLTTKS